MALTSPAVFCESFAGLSSDTEAGSWQDLLASFRWRLFWFGLFHSSLSPGYLVCGASDACCDGAGPLLQEARASLWLWWSLLLACLLACTPFGGRDSPRTPCAHVLRQCLLSSTSLSLSLSLPEVIPAKVLWPPALDRKHCTKSPRTQPRARQYVPSGRSSAYRVYCRLQDVRTHIC